MVLKRKQYSVDLEEKLSLKIGAAKKITPDLIKTPECYRMDYNLIRDVWLNQWTIHKKNQIESKELIIPCNRLVPQGKKGIGRFDAHKLEEEVENNSKKRS